jgi:uncharacterized protein
MREADLRIEVHDNPRAIGAGAWEALRLADADGNVLLSHAYLSALQASACATPRTGWQAQFLLLWRGPQLAAAVPLYVKAHSYGEYVFDWSWAQAQERTGRAYYPKALVAVPFTPVGGSRILARDEAARGQALDALLDLVRGSEVSSLHILFPPAGQMKTFERAGMLVRTGIQFHWTNAGYADFEHFLASLEQPKRKKIRAERRKVHEAGIVIERLTGSQITLEDWRFFLRCYEATYAAHGAEPYLNLRFFLAIAESMGEQILLVLARREGVPVASALGIFDPLRSALYGRYWGSLDYIPCLHFECCYYQMIEFAIERGLASFEGGAQGAHKLARGLDPVMTHSAHWIRDPSLAAAVRRFVARERDAIAVTVDELAEHSARKEALL